MSERRLTETQDFEVLVAVARAAQALLDVAPTVHMTADGHYDEFWNRADRLGEELGRLNRGKQT